MSRHSATWGALAVLALGLTSCQATGPTPATSPQLRLAPCTVAGVQAQCGTLPVLENRARGTGRTIQLRVAVLPARSQPREPDPVFWLAGGPGGAATESAGAASQLLSLVNERRDVVLVDQRGTGGSNDLRCPQGTVPSRWAEELRSCLARLNGDPRAYTTAWAMDDLDDVRAALGYDKINLYGISYGATAAQVYVQRHPTRARAGILESGTVLGVPILERFPASAQRALNLLFARCAADAGCHAAFPDPAADLRKIIARLERGPIDLPVTDPSTGKPVRYTRHAMAAGLLGALSDLRTAEERLRRAETEAAARGSFLRADDMQALVNPNDICAAMPAPSSDAMYRPATTSPVPMLFINGWVDPKDPPANVADAPRVYSRSMTLAVPGQAHDYNVDPTCRALLFDAFIRTATTVNLPSACLQEQAVPPFDLG